MHNTLLPRGVRDFGPDQMLKRNYIFDVVRNIFETYGFMPLATSALEKLSVLMGKYSEEGDKLVFKVLNSGNFLSKVTTNNFEQGHHHILPNIAEKGLRYDLTIPLARYVAMNRHTLTFPFKRYQIQPVWRADRPQKGRYREFYQCDIDTIGTTSLLCEAEIIMLIYTVFQQLRIQSYTIKISHRKILKGIATWIGEQDKVNMLCIALDKLEKIGQEKVWEMLKEKQFSIHALDKLSQFISIKGNNATKIALLKKFMKDNVQISQGIQDLESILHYADTLGMEQNFIEVDYTLARGLNYYTGAIMEVAMKDIPIGSLGGGGRYDQLTSMFGLPNVSGVGFSFGIERIYEVMEILNLFPGHYTSTTQILLINDGDIKEHWALAILSTLRTNNICAEIYPVACKRQKQLQYANKKNIPFVGFIDNEEKEVKNIIIKNMTTGVQAILTEKEMLAHIKSTNL